MGTNKREPHTLSVKGASNPRNDSAARANLEDEINEESENEGSGEQFNIITSPLCRNPVVKTPDISEIVDGAQEDFEDEESSPSSERSSRSSPGSPPESTSSAQNIPIICYKCGGAHYGFNCTHTFFIPKSPRRWIDSQRRVNWSKMANAKRKRLFDTIKASEDIDDFSEAWDRLVVYEKTQKRAQKIRSESHFNVPRFSSTKKPSKWSKDHKRKRRQRR